MALFGWIYLSVQVFEALLDGIHMVITIYKTKPKLGI
jgi:hypothetical protein